VRFLRSCPREYSWPAWIKLVHGHGVRRHDGTELRREKRLKKEQGSTEKQVSHPARFARARRIHPAKFRPRCIRGGPGYKEARK